MRRWQRKKVFSEWCAAYYDIQDDNEICANVIPYDKSWCEYEMSGHIAILAPTHYQLIEWLRENYEIDVVKVIDYKIYIKDELWASDIESINDALFGALELVDLGL